jgi:DNA-binding transcriptional regulator YdaS (Cro superfamily)
MSITESIEKAAKILGNQESLGALCGVTKAAVSHWKSINSIPVEYCYRIEEATGGAVTRRDLRPKDWHDIWPDLKEVA